MYIKQYANLVEALLFAHGENAQREANRMADMNEKTGHLVTALQWRETVAALASAKAEMVRAAA
jgi:hypothetical protein